MQIINDAVKSMWIYTICKNIIVVHFINPKIMNRNIWSLISKYSNCIYSINIKHTYYDCYRKDQIWQITNQPFFILSECWLLKFSIPLQSMSYAHFSAKNMNCKLRGRTDSWDNMEIFSFLPNNWKKRSNRTNLQCDRMWYMKKLEQKYQINNIKITGKEISNQPFWHFICCQPFMQ